jgi:hypothetical protein
LYSSGLVLFSRTKRAALSIASPTFALSSTLLKFSS